MVSYPLLRECAVYSDFIRMTNESTWFPIAASDDLPYRHVYHAQLLGTEMAVWRADDGFVNAWENRCLHRGVRLSIGINKSVELKCQYRGWRYANGTAGCTYIPAHPANSPARTIQNRVYPAVERYGLVWSGIEPEGEVPNIEFLNDRHHLVLRAVSIDSPTDIVIEELQNYRFNPSFQLDTKHVGFEVFEWSTNTFIIQAQSQNSSTAAVMIAQPVDSHKTVVRGVIEWDEGLEEIPVLHHHAQLINKFRDRVESRVASLPVSKSTQFSITKPSYEFRSSPKQQESGRIASHQVRIARKWQTAKGISAFDLEPVNGVLPTFQPGAHIDVHMPNYLVRQYSLINGPGQTRHYTIGVKREANSSGGSHYMVDSLPEGGKVDISEPRNNFPLRRDALETILIAGGIGITPLLSMARLLDHANLPYKLHFFAQSENHVAFSEVLSKLGRAVVLHLGHGVDQTKKSLHDILSNYQKRMHVYICGPTPMLEAARVTALKVGWPDEAVHFEYFKNPNTIDDSSEFEIALARSCLTLKVPSGKTIVEILRYNNVAISTSCEQGACGTCIIDVLEGEPDHQDVYLREFEKTSQKKIISCVSRAKSKRLVLDI